MSEIWLLFSIMASSLANASDSELVKEFRRRFIVFQWYKKEHIEANCNDGEEMDEEIYEEFKDWLENSSYYREIDDDTKEMWENFKKENEEEQEDYQEEEEEEEDKNK